ncbi:FKBP-type peptidyl-prolyl cis-trans isomerase, partial [Salmonella sp. s54925]|uniref:FKBP-type peptidyl-prolyl cis-trans isomerase n=1 Tax=Salmonella sp. s54925 TaxID=3159674 RepID=UPI00397EA96B
KTQSGDTLHMHYTGKLKDGTEFDSSIPRGEPFVFTLGKGQVIKGWDQGLLGMCVGEKKKAGNSS